MKPNKKRAYLYALREKHKLNQRECAKLLNLKFNSYQPIESGLNNPRSDIEFACKIGEVFGFDYLVVIKWERDYLIRCGEIEVEE